MIRKTIDMIGTEGKADADKHAWCDTEQTTSEANKADKEADIGTLEGNINELQISISDIKENIRLATEDLQTNRETQTETTDTRKGRNELFHQNLKDQQDAQRILAKAIEVLTKYYAFLHAHNAEKSYDAHTGKDSGGGNLERLAGKSQAELEAACNADPECQGFNSAGWLKKSIAPSSEWYDWDEGTLYVKVLSFLQIQQPVAGETETWGDEMEGQRGEGNKAIDMLKFIMGQSKSDEASLRSTEESNVADYENNMANLADQETQLSEDIAQYELNLANQEKSRQQATEDHTGATADRDAIVKYLATIEPGCTFIQSNLQARKDAQASETAALNNAISTLEGTPTFQAAVAAAEQERLGDCVLEGSDYACGKDGSERGTAKCEACVEGVTVYGYCTQNPDASGCSTATDTSSAGALA